ncbi:hypothetical protein D3C87_1860660 [compost metagenome]
MRARRQFDLDQFQRQVGVRRDMPPDVSALRVAPDRLMLASRQAAFLNFCAGDQCRHGQAEGARKPCKQRRRRAAVCALDLVDHGAGDAGTLGKLAQRPAADFPFEANAIADALIKAVHFSIHRIVI